MWKGAIAGACGGLIGAAAMERFQALWSWTAKRVRPPRQAHASDDDPATVRVAERVSEAIRDEPLAEPEKAPAGEAVHYAMGIATGALYGAASDVLPFVTGAVGLPFGIAVWLAADELALWRAGLAKKPTEYPASTHAYAFVSHLVYGATTELVRRSVRALLD